MTYRSDRQAGVEMDGHGARAERRVSERPFKFPRGTLLLEGTDLAPRPRDNIARHER